MQNPINKVVSPQIQNKVNPYKYILGVGRLSYEKGFDQLITAFNKAQLPKDIYLLIIGEGPEEGSLKNLIDVLGLQERVKLLGFKKDVYNYYQGAELFVLPSRNEGYPNALIEAMSIGCACISMDCEFGPSEIIQHNHNGLLVADKDVTGLSYAITLLIHDSSLKAKLAENAKKINITNDLDSITSQWEAII
ncbi:glycosyltransferase [Pseudoxanthomonas sp. SGD-10]|nr:glycosyltransferase [Pseudoxanthomonas sp. SGD-10]